MRILMILLLLSGSVGVAPPSPVPIELGLGVTLDGADISTYWREADSSLSYDDQINARSLLNLELIDPANDLHLQPGEAIVFRDVHEAQAVLTSDGQAILTSDGDALNAPDIEVIFGGTIERVKEEMLGAITDSLHATSLEVVSFDQLADRHTIAKIYEDMLAGDIARELVALRLAADGVSDDGVEDGPRVAFVLFNYISVADALNKLSALTGMHWEIDEHLVLRFQSRLTTVAPYTITDANPHAQRIAVQRSRERYRNRQIIRAGRDLTDPREELFVGDGERQTFNVAFPAGTEPVITLNGLPQDVGIRGVETGKDWYWNKDTTEISQDEAALPLDDSDSLSVTYRGLFPVVVIVQDDAEIADRQTIEGGSGQYEHVADEPNIDSAAVAVDTALAYLDRDGMIPITLEIETQEHGYKAGQLVTVDLTRENIHGEFLITSVSASYIGSSLTEFSYRVIATDSGYLGGWVEYFQRLAASQRAALAREDETLIGIRTVASTVQIAASVTVEALTPETQIGIMQIGLGEIGELPSGPWDIIAMGLGSPSGITPFILFGLDATESGAAGSASLPLLLLRSS